LCLLIGVILDCLVFREKKIGGSGQVSDEGVFGDAVTCGLVDGTITDRTGFSLYVKILATSAGETSSKVTVLLVISTFVDDGRRAILYLVEKLLFIVIN
jgi:hypothetical protein